MTGGSSRQSGSPVRALGSLAFAVILTFGFVHFGPSLSTIAGDRIAKSVVKSATTPNGTEAATWTKAAKTKFVPTMHRKFPRLTHGVADTQIARIATHTCTVLDGYAYTPHYQDTLRRDTRKALTHGHVKPTGAQVNGVIRTAAHTTCPEKDFLTGQFQ